MAKGKKSASAGKAQTQSQGGASTALSRAVNPIAHMAATATGNTTGKQQKLVYASEGALRLEASAAKGAAQKEYHAALSKVFGTKKTMDAKEIPPALAAAKVANPRRVFRRAIRAGILLKA